MKKKISDLERMNNVSDINWFKKHCPYGYIIDIKGNKYAEFNRHYTKLGFKKV